MVLAVSVVCHLASLCEIRRAAATTSHLPLSKTRAILPRDCQPDLATARLRAVHGQSTQDDVLAGSCASQTSHLSPLSADELVDIISP